MHEFLEINNNWWYKKYHKNLKKRYWTFTIALSLFLQRDGGKIVETGCQRHKDDWGGGCSTTIFGDFCKHYNKQLVTIDNNPENLEVAKNETKEFADHIKYIFSESVEYLKRNSGFIDLLYLDSMDCKENPVDDNTEPQTHALNEFKAVEGKLHDESIVLIDDNLFANGGKTKLLKEYLIQKGWTMLMDYKQSLWIKK